MNWNNRSFALILLTLVGCQTHHDPDSMEIDAGSWNRSQALDGVYYVTVRGESTATESFGVQFKQPDESPKGFENVNRIWSIALDQTCHEGVRKVISKRQEIRELQMPDGSLTELGLVRIPGTVFAEPWIHSVVQCNDSTATEDEIKQKFFKSEVEQEQRSNELLQKLNDSLEKGVNG